MWLKHEFVLIIYAGVDAVDCRAEPKNNEGRLRKFLFCGYDKDSRPTDDKITIQLKMIVKGFDFFGRLLVSSWLSMVNNFMWNKFFSDLASIINMYVVLNFSDLEGSTFEMESEWIQQFNIDNAIK